jgi:hypothetical protein
MCGVSLVVSLTVFFFSSLLVSLRYIGVVFFKKLNIFDIPMMCFSFFSYLTVISIVMGCVYGLVWYYSLLFKKGYYVALSSFGVSARSIALVPLRCIMLNSMILLWGSVSFFPHMMTVGKGHTKTVQRSIDLSCFLPQMPCEFGPYYFYAHTRHGPGSFGGGVISVGQDLVFGRTALVTMRKQAASVRLEKGCGVFMDPQSGRSFISFDAYDALFDLEKGHRTRDRNRPIGHKPLLALNMADPAEKAEIVRRVTLALLPFVTVATFYSVITYWGRRFLVWATVGSVMVCGCFWMTASWVGAPVVLATFVLACFILVPRRY